MFERERRNLRAVVVARQMPEKLTTAPMSVRLLVRTAISRAMSKSSS
jgi:hypothetical protein